MKTTCKDGIRVYSLRVQGSKLDRLSEIAESEHHTLSQKLRVMIDAELAAHDPEREAA